MASNASSSLLHKWLQLRDNGNPQGLVLARRAIDREGIVIVDRDATALVRFFSA